MTDKVLKVAQRKIQILEQMFEDITRELYEKQNELLKTIEELKSTRIQLIQAEKLSTIGLLTSGIAHELNSPLTGLLNMLELHKKNIKENTQEYEDINDMLKAVHFMADIVENLTVFSRKSKEDEFAEVNLNDVIKSTLSFSVFHLIKNNVEILENYSNDLQNIRGEQGQLQQVVLNIITNSRDVMPNGGKFIINTRNSLDRKKVIVEFIDSGTGIKKEDLHNVFEPFFTTKAPGKGTGLGLHISREIIKNHHGEISIESEEDKGAKVSLIFPSAHS